MKLLCAPDISVIGTVILHLSCHTWLFLDLNKGHTSYHQNKQQLTKKLMKINTMIIFQILILIYDGSIQTPYTEVENTPSLVKNYCLGHPLFWIE